VTWGRADGDGRHLDEGGKKDERKGSEWSRKANKKAA